MKHKPLNKMVFQIHSFSITNYMTYSNLIILVSVLVAMTIGFAYAYLETPEFKARGILENQPYSAVNNVAVNPIDQIQKNAFNIIREMDLINTSDVLSKVVQELHLNIELKPQTIPLVGLFIYRIKESIKLSEFTKGIIDKHLGSNGELVEFNQFTVPNEWISKEFILKYEGDANYSLQLPTGITLQGHLNAPLFFKNKEGEINVNSIYGSKGSKFVLIPNNISITAAELSEHLVLNMPNIQNKQGEAKSFVDQNLIEVSYIDRNPIRAAAIVNSVLKHAVIASQSRKKNEAQMALGLLTIQKELVEKKLYQQNQRLTHIKALKNPLDPVDEGQYLLKQLGNINDETRVVEQKLVEVAQTMTASNPQYIAILNQLKALENSKKNILYKISQAPSSINSTVELETKIAANTEVLTKLTYQVEQLNAMKESSISDINIVQLAEIPLVNVTYTRAIIMLLTLGIGLIMGYI